MFKLNKAIAPLLALVVASSCLAGCGGGSSSSSAASNAADTGSTGVQANSSDTAGVQVSPSDTSSTASSPAVPPSKISYRKITLGALWPFTDPQQTNPMRMLYMLSDQWMKDNPGAQIEFQLISTDYVQYDQQMKVLAASNSLPDVFQYQVSTSMQDLYDHGYITDLDKLMTELGLMDAMNPVAVKICRSGDPKGRLMSLPMSLSYHGLWVNEDILKQLGLSYNENGTWDDLFNLCKQIAAKNYVPIAVNGKDGWNMTTVMHMWLMKKDGIGVLNDASYGLNGAKFTDPDFIAAAQMMQDFGQAGCFGPDFMAVDNQGMIDQFLSGKAVMLPATSDLCANLDDPTLNKLGDNAVDFKLYPSVVGGLPADQSKGLMEMQTGMGFVVGAKQLDDSVKDWMKYVFSRYGDFTWDNGGYVPGFNVSDMSNTTHYKAMALQMLNNATDGELWFEAKLPSKGVDYSFKNISLVAAGQLSPEDFMKNVQATVDEQNGQ